MPLLIGILLLTIILASTLASYRGVKESAREVGDERFQNVANRFLRRIVLIDFVMFIFGIGGAIVLSRGITRPLNQLTRSASRLSSGNYDGLVHIHHNDELGALGKAFNLMVGKVRDSQTELERKVQALEESEQRLEKALADLQEKTHELALMTEQLWQAAKLATMGELAASVAHELNNPLATLALHAESLLDRLPSEDPKRRAVLVIEQEVERMANLVKNLLLFSRRSHRQSSTVDLSKELGNSLEFIHYHLRSHKITVVTNFASDLPNVNADRQQLRQLFLNLLTNCSDAMPGGGTLALSARQVTLDGGAPALQVKFSDTGMGIHPKDLKKLWEPFFTTKPEGKGTGLGLPICRRIVEEHKGTIDIESERGKGTTVRIVMPAMSAGASQA